LSPATFSCATATTQSSYGTTPVHRVDLPLRGWSEEMKKTFAERCKTMEQCLPEAPYREKVEALHSEMLGELEALRAENECLKYREKNCATENQAMLVGAVRFMQEATEAVGMTMADSPPQILERMVWLLKRSQRLETRLIEDQLIFMSYAHHHSEKGTTEGNAKAAANAGIAQQVANVLCSVQS
jgi:hypothetical protein